MLFNIDASKESLDSFLNNPNLGYNAISGNQIAAEVGRAVAPYAQRLLKDPQYSDTMGG
jgi:hypothetical protein